MPSRIEDYALIGDLETAALVAKDGSIDWLCVPRFDSGACFAALLGSPEHGRWLLTPAASIRETRRRYRADTLILETHFETDQGAVTLIDFMPVRTRYPVLVRIVQGDGGKVPMHMQFVLRFDYGSIIPWVRRSDYGIRAIAGPDGLQLRTDVELKGEEFTTVADFTVSKGERIPFTMAWYPAEEPEPSPEHALDPEQALRDTEQFWKEWVGRCTYQGSWRDAVARSLITLKALTHQRSGGIVAAPTTSLPEDLGGMRNWDYRYCWLRDATFVLLALMNCGYYDEARNWGQWLLRAAAGNPANLQIMYGICGERRLSEWEVPWLPGYENSRPVRIGNAAFAQFQLDVYGEVLDAIFQCRRHEVDNKSRASKTATIGAPNESPDPFSQETSEWWLESKLADFVENCWQKPDHSMWEVRGDPRHFTASKVMAWLALDRAIKDIEMFGLEGPLERWRRARQMIHDQVCKEGYNAQLDTFVQSYGSDQLDATLLLLPLVGFLPASDPRIRKTVAAIERGLDADGFIRRYIPATSRSTTPTPEGAFLACSFWMVDNLALTGRQADAEKLFERLLSLRNDVGLLSEEYDFRARRLVGNFPQAFSHIGVINSACNLVKQGPSQQRGKG